MGIPVIVVGKQHVCPMSDGSKPHVGGQVTKGVNGVFIDGMPVATIGSTCVCCSPKTNSITSGAMGILIDGKAIAVLGSQTEHGGNVVEGIPGVTVSGGFATKSDEPGDFEPRIFNLQWKKSSVIIKNSYYEDKVILYGDVVGYNDGDEITLNIGNEDTDKQVDSLTGIVNDGKIEIEWFVEKSKIEQDTKQL